MSTTPVGFYGGEGGVGPQGQRGIQGVGISSITFVDNLDGSVNLTFHMTDDTTQGPFTSSLVSDTLDVSSLTINGNFTLPTTDATTDGDVLTSDSRGLLSRQTPSTNLQDAYDNSTEPKTLTIPNNLTILGGTLNTDINGNSSTSAFSDNSFYAINAGSADFATRSGRADNVNVSSGFEGSSLRYAMFVPYTFSLGFTATLPLTPAITVDVTYEPLTKVLTVPTINATTYLNLPTSSLTRPAVYENSCLTPTVDIPND
jgi:hypothetical protein